MDDESDELVYCGICQEMADHGKAGKPMVVTFHHLDVPAPRFPYLEFSPV